jgi:acetoin utilization deacetylase AcuC-like enzyme
MPIKVFYNPLQTAQTDSFSPSPSKPKLVVEDWLAAGLDISVLESGPAGTEFICKAHNPVYVTDVLSLKADNGFGNRDPMVARALPYVVGSMVQAATSAALLRDTAACSPTSGFHHAGFEWGGGFCTFNGLMVAAMHLLDAGLVKKLAIIDCDYHYGNGTDNIISRVGVPDRVFHWTSYSKYNGPRDATAFLRHLPMVVKEAKAFGAEVVLYQAGADQHINDPLGGMLTDAQLAKRDRLLFRACRDAGISVAWNLAGGYQQSKDGSIKKVLAIHRNTMKECINVFG